MKVTRYISTILSSLILFANIGLALNVHFCHGKIASVGVSYKTITHCQPNEHKTKSCCAKAEVQKTKNCCKHSFIKLQDKADDAVTNNVQLDLAAFCLFQPVVPQQVFSTINAEIKKDAPSFYCNSHAPPLFKLYCQYIFYA